MQDIKITGFEMIQRLGTGGMATVWKARQISLDRIVAIKILNAKLASDPADVQRFQSEAQAAAKLKHQGIVQVYDANIENGVYYYVMEYVAGYTVGEWLRRKGTLAERDALLVAECVATALEYAWKTAGIIHCDIKPDNLMIDADGTVKVADLGLSRTIGAMGAASGLSREVIGTPAYISPEQAAGAADLDCRADIYSLGATIYHLVTGKGMFEGHPEHDIFDMQIKDTVDDPLDLNPGLSKGIAYLLDRMLAKNVADRYLEWAPVRTDVLRLKKRLSVLNPLPANVPSTIRRSAKRGAPTVRRFMGGVHEEGRASLAKRVILIGAAGLLLIFCLFAVIKAAKRPPPRLPPVVRMQPPSPPPTTSKGNEEEALKMLEVAREWAKANPGSYDEAIRRFRDVAFLTKGTKYNLMAEDEIAKIATEKQKQVDKIIETLDQNTSALVAEGKFVEAAKVYETYDGSYAKATEQKRADCARALRARQLELENAERKKKEDGEKVFNQVLDDVVAKLMGDNVEGAQAVIAAAKLKAEFAYRESELDLIRGVLDSIVYVDQRVLESFRAQKDREITVNLKSGPRKLVVVDVRGDKVAGRQRMSGTREDVMIPVNFTVAELVLQERVQRMGSDSAQEVAVLKGLREIELENYAKAKEYFGKVQPILAGRLVAMVDREMGRKTNASAKDALSIMMRSLGITFESYDRQTWLNAVARKTFTRDTAPRMLDAVSNYRKKYGATEFAKEAEPVLAAIEEAQRALLPGEKRIERK